MQVGKKAGRPEDMQMEPELRKLEDGDVDAACKARWHGKVTR